MPPNVLHSWDSNASKRQFYGDPVVHFDADGDGDENDHHRPDFNAKLFLSPKQPPPSKQSTPSNDDDDGRALWHNILQKDVDTATGEDDGEIRTSKSSKLLASLSSIIIFDDEAREREWLHRFGGRLSSVSSELLEGLR